LGAYVSVKVAGLTYPRHVSEEIDLLARALGFACQVFLFVDYGGTLSAGDASDHQRPNDDVLLRLEQLAGEPSFSVFVLSGRTVGELGALVGLEDVGLIGQRGLEIRRAHAEIEYPSDASSLESLIDHLELDAHRRLAPFDGYSIENRGFALTLRMDGCDPCRTREISQSFVRVVGDLDRHAQMEVLYGQSSIEARVAGWHKGDAVRHILREADIEDSLAIYIGDDVTDEDAFEAVDDWAETDGGATPWFVPEHDDDEAEPIQSLTILVSPEPRPTRASLFVRGPEEVYEFLSSLATIAAALL
jgi:trehalose 6-phosphate phosphatase